jgi:hypothetical protein
MTSSSRFGSIARGLLLLAAYAGGIASASAQTEAASTITELTTVDVQQIGNPPSGPFPVVVEHDPGLATHTIYRPRELSMDEHRVLVWGEGGCAKNGLMFPEYLSEIASHGFVVIADGPPIARPAGAPRAGGGGPPPGGGAGPPADRFTMVNGTALVAAMDWLEGESKNRNSRFYGKVNVERIAAMGMSCGGLMSYGASNDSRVATVGIWNSGLFEDERNAAIYAGIHGSVIIVTGGESDVAYATANAISRSCRPGFRFFTESFHPLATAARTTRITVGRSAPSPSRGSNGSSGAIKARLAAVTSSGTIALCARTLPGRSVRALYLETRFAVGHEAALRKRSRLRSRCCALCAVVRSGDDLTQVVQKKDDPPPYIAASFAPGAMIDGAAFSRSFSKPAAMR